MDIEKGVKEYLEKVGSVDRKDIIEHDFREGINWTLAQLKANPLEARVSREFCGQCTYLSVTEDEQNFHPEKKDEIHFCNLFKKRVLHFNQHPNLPRLDECKIIGTR